MRRWIVIWLACFLAINGHAQCAAKNEAILPGEHLTYELKFNWKFIWVSAGKAQMNLDATTYQGKPCYKTELLSVSNKKVDFFFKMRDTLTCITTDRLEPLYFRKGAEEGSKYTVDEVRFSYKDNKCIVDQYRKRNDRQAIVTKDTLDECVYDMLSILLQARSFDPTSYKKGDKILFPMATGKKVEEQTLIYRGKENFKAENGVKYRCLVFSLVEYDKKKKEKEVLSPKRKSRITPWF